MNPGARLSLAADTVSIASGATLTGYGTLTNNTLDPGTVPAGYNYSIDTSVGGRVALVVTNVPKPSAWAVVLLGGGIVVVTLGRRAMRV